MSLAPEDTPDETPEQTPVLAPDTPLENAADYLADIRAKLDTEPFDPETFDPALLAEQMDFLQDRFAAPDGDTPATILDMQLALNDILQDQMARIIGAHFDPGSDVPQSEEFSFSSRTASMVQAVDKALNNSMVLVNALRMPAADRPSTWKDAATGKTQTDIFRKEMIYSLSIIDNAKNLGRTIGSSNALFEDSDEQNALIAEFALDALKVAARAFQLHDVAVLEGIAKSSFKDLSALAFDDVTLQAKLDFFLLDVGHGAENGELPPRQTGEHGSETEHADYKATVKELLKELKTDLEAKQEAATKLSQSLDANLDELADKHLELAELNQNRTALADDPSEDAAAARQALDQDIARVRADMDSLDGITQAQQADLDVRTKQIAEYEILTNKMAGTKEDFDAASASSGITDGVYKLFSLGSTISGMVANGLSGADDGVAYAAGGMSLAADLSDLAAAVAKFKSVKNLETGAGAVGGVIGLGPQIATFAASIADIKNAPEGYEAHYIGEAVVQGANLAMGLAIGALTTYATLAGTTVSSAVPVLGVMASLASAVNPLQWASFSQMNDRLDDVRAKKDIESDAYETSADFLSQLLETSRNIEVGFYVAETVTGVAGGVGTTAAAATGVGAPVALAIAGITAGLQGILSATKQAALNKAADNIAEKIRDFDGGVEGFFDQSFDFQTDRELERFLEDAQALIDGGFDSVSALGSVQMTGSDLELAGLSGIGGELARTQDHFAGHLEADDLETGDWDREAIFFDSGTIHLGSAYEAATGKQNMLQFISPMAAAGEEELDRDKTGKNSYETTLQIKDLSGWTLIDGGDSTTFDLRNVVTKARDSANAALEDITMVIKGNAGDDMFLMTETSGSSSKQNLKTNIDGGTGQDSVTYGNLTHLVQGLRVTTNGSDQLIVRKTVDADTTILEGAIGTTTVQRGKESETVEYSYITANGLGETTVLYDKLKDIEMLAASHEDDTITVANYNEALVVAGLSGDDFIKLGQGHGGLGGDGDDTFLPALKIETTGATETDLPETVEISGGAGHDTLLLQDNWAKTLFDLGAHYLIAEQILANDEALLEALMPASLASEVGEDIAVATIANLLSEDGWAMTSFLAFEGIETVKWDVRAMIDVVHGPGADLGGKLDLGEFVDAAQTVLNRSTVGDYEGLIVYDASKLEATKVVGGEAIGYTIQGTAGDEGILGTAHADLLFGGDGDDWLNGHDGTNVVIGADGADTFHFDMARHFHTTVSLVDFSLDDTPDYGDQTAGDRFHFDLSGISTADLAFSQKGDSDTDLHVTSDTATVVIEDYFTDAYALFTDGPKLSFSAATGERALDYAGVTPFLGDGTDIAPKVTKVDELYILAGRGGTAGFKGDKGQIIAGDFNGDGMTDFIEQESAGHKRTLVHLATGDGAFEYDNHLYKNAGEKSSFFRGDTTNIIVGDFNGDDKDDFIRQEKGKWDDDGNLTAQLFLATGGGHFDRAGQLNELAGRSDVFKGDLTNIIVGDFNGDGTDDFIRQDYREGRDYRLTTELYQGDGDGTFTRLGDLADLTGESDRDGNPFKGDEIQLYAADYDGDGRDDILAQSAEREVEIYLSEALVGGFAHAGTFDMAAPQDRTRLVAGDYDGDGDADLIRQEYGRWDDDNVFTANLFEVALA